MRLVLYIVVSLLNAAEVPVKFQRDRTILNTNLAVSRLYKILRKYVFSDIETRPRRVFTNVQLEPFGPLHIIKTVKNHFKRDQYFVTYQTLNQYLRTKDILLKIR